MLTIPKQMTIMTYPYNNWGDKCQVWGAKGQEVTRVWYLSRDSQSEDIT